MEIRDEISRLEIDREFLIGMALEKGASQHTVSHACGWNLTTLRKHLSA